MWEIQLMSCRWHLLRWEIQLMSCQWLRSRWTFLISCRWHLLRWTFRMSCRWHPYDKLFWCHVTDIMISYILLDETRIEFINGKPPRLKRQKQRNLQDGADHEELLLLDDMKRRNFIYFISPIYAYIKRHIPNTFISVNFFVGLAWFFAIQLKKSISREFYRRKQTSIFWLQMHYQEVKNYIQEHRIIIHYNNHDYIFE